MKVFTIRLIYSIIFKIGRKIPYPSSLGRWWFFNLTTPLYESYWKQSGAGKVPVDTSGFNSDWLISQLGKEETETALQILSPYFASLPDAMTSLKVALQRLQRENEHLKGQPLVSYMEYIKASLARYDTPDKVAQTIAVMGGADGARAILALFQTIQPRDKNIAAVAAILPGSVVVISRGKRELVNLGDVYEIRAGNNKVASLCVFRVAQKMSFARPLWVSENCPPVKRGTHLNYVGKNES